MSEGAQSFGYAARAEEPASGYPGDWRLDVFAICAPPDRVPGYQPIHRTTDVSPADLKQIDAPCPSGKRVIGTGAWIDDGNAVSGHIGLQLTKADDSLHLARAAARETAGGDAETWRLTATAICADPIVTATARESAGPHAACPAGTHVYSLGGGGTADAPFLEMLWSNYDLTTFSAATTGQPAARATAICA